MIDGAFLTQCGDPFSLLLRFFAHNQEPSRVISQFSKQSFVSIPSVTRVYKILKSFKLWNYKLDTRRSIIVRCLHHKNCNKHFT